MAVSIDRDLNDVLIFLQVVRSGSFTAAGRALQVPTSTVSRRVARLEEQLGVRLLQRTTRKLSLTDSGQLYFERGTGFFAQLEEAENMLADAQTNPMGRVRATAPVEHTVSTRVVMPFLERFPEVRVDMELTGRSVNIIEEGFDVAISTGPLASMSVVAHKLMDSKFNIVASPAYLDRRGTPGDIDAISDHDCVIFGTTSSAPRRSLLGPRGANLRRSRARELRRAGHALARRCNANRRARLNARFRCLRTAPQSSARPTRWRPPCLRARALARAPPPPGAP